MIELASKEKIQVSSSLESAWEKVFKLKDARFFELPARQELWTASQKRANEIRAAADTSLIVGIGGSSLGARAFEHAFGVSSPHRVLFAESPDQTAAGRWRRDLRDPKRTHFVLTSKSGKTLETLALLDYWTEILKKSGADLSKQATAVCGAGPSPLRDWAEKRRVPILPVPEDVGGRFSVLTPVGLLPMALLGIPLEGISRGADWALSQRPLILQLAAASLDSFRDQRWITQMWTYSESFRILGFWWQQLWSESLAKRVNRAGGPAPRASTPMVCCGPQDQHSLLQQVQEGSKDKWIICLRDPDAEAPGLEFPCDGLKNLDKTLVTARLGRILAAEADGFLGALKEAGVPYLELRVPSSKPESWGAFFMAWELIIAVMGEALEINAFDQPGVELGKRLALQSLRQRL